MGKVFGFLFSVLSLYTHPTVHALNLILFIPLIHRGVFRLLYRVFYRCILAPSSGNVFHYVWLRCYTDCGCLDGPIFPPRLYNINTKIIHSPLLQHFPVSSLVGASNQNLSSVIPKFSDFGVRINVNNKICIPFWNFSVLLFYKHKHYTNTYVSHLFPLGCTREVWWVGGLVTGLFQCYNVRLTIAWSK